MEIDWAKLKEPFLASDIEWRMSRCGMNGDKPWGVALAYVTNRAIMDRLDLIVGPGGWQNEFREGPGGGILCGISIKIGDEWVTKWDGAENTNIDAVKGGISGSMKRAAVQWGPGRYLYNLTETFITCQINKGNDFKYQGKSKNAPAFYWKPPQLPPWALPVPPQQQPKHQPSHRQTTLQNVWAEGTRDKFIIICDENGYNSVQQALICKFYLNEVALEYMTLEASNDMIEMLPDVLKGFKGSHDG